MSNFALGNQRDDSSKKTHNDVLWCNGSTSDSGSASEGSSPSKTTKQNCS